MERVNRKPARITSSTPANRGKTFSFPSDLDGPEISIITKKKSVLDLVLESVKTLGLPKKGASYQAIKKWVLAHQDVKPGSIKLAILKGIERGLLVRPHNSTAKGVLGWFCLPAENKNLEKKVQRPKPNKNKSPSETTKTYPTKVAKKSAGVSKIPLKKTTQNEPTAAAKNVPTKDTKTLKTKEAKKYSTAVARKSVTRAIKRVNSKAAKSSPKKAEVPSKAKGSPPKAEMEGKKPSPTLNRRNKVKADPKKAAIGTKIAKASVSTQSEVKEKEVKESMKRKAAGTSKVKAAGTSKVKAAGTSKLKAAGTSKVKDNIDEQSNETKRNKSVGKKLNPTRLRYRKDLSDTEVDVKKKRFKNVKSYSSDTELEISKRMEAKDKKRPGNKKEKSIF